MSFAVKLVGWMSACALAVCAIGSLLLAPLHAQQSDRSRLINLAGDVQSPQPPRDVLVIVYDDAGWTEWGHMTAMQSIAERGMVFTQFRVNPVCSPSRLSLLQGLYARRSGVGDIINAFQSSTNSPPPDYRSPFLSSALLPQMETCLVGKWHLGRAAVRLATQTADLLDDDASGPPVHGFSEMRAVSLNSIALGPGATGYFDWYRVQNQARTANFTTYATDEQRDQAIAWWEAHAGSRRFMWWAPNAPHHPYDTPPGYTELDPADVRGKYLQVLDYANQATWDLLSHVDPETTLVVMLPDNGVPDDARPAGWPSGVVKGSALEGGIRVPLVMAGPGIQAGSSARLISAVDVPVTILELCEVESRGFDDGVSFADALGPWSGAPARAWTMSERYGNKGCSANCPQPIGYDDLAIVERITKYPGTLVDVQLALRVVDADGSGPGGYETLVYDLLHDPNQIHPEPLSWWPAQVQARLQSELASLPPRL